MTKLISILIASSGVVLAMAPLAYTYAALT